MVLGASQTMKCSRNVTDMIAIQGLFLALFIGMLSGVVPSWGAAKRSVAATLREVF